MSSDDPNAETNDGRLPPGLTISGSTALQIGSGNVQNIHLHQTVREVVWPVRVGPVVPPADGFQHRQVETLLLPTQAAGRTVVLTQVLRGMGGVGKTQLAAAWADRVWRSKQVDLLVWITARDRTSIISGYAEAAAATGITADDPQQAAARMRDWLAGTEKRWLVVLDDVSVPADLNGWWPPDSPAGATVVTTRRRDAALAGQGRRLVDVGVFTPDEATAYLAGKFASYPRLGDDIPGVVEDLGSLPLALAQAAAYMRDGGLSCEQYRRRFADRRRRLEQLVPEPGSLPDQYHATVAATWSLSIEVADRARPAGLSRPLLQVCSVLDPNGIPLEVLYTNAVYRWLNLDRHEESGPGAEVVADALAVLHRLSLLDVTAAGDDGQPQRPAVRVHALVQRAVREDLPPNRFDQVGMVAADALNQIWRERRDALLAPTLQANGTALLGVTASLLYAPSLHPIVYKIGDSYGDHGNVAEAVRYFETLVARLPDLCGARDLATFEARDHLLVWIGKGGAHRAARDGLLALSIELMDVVSPNDRLLINVQTNHAFFLGEDGEYEAAAAQFSDLASRVQSLDSPDGRLLASLAGNEAYFLGKSGAYQRAAAAYNALVPTMVNVYGPEHIDTLKARSNAAGWLGKAGDQSAAFNKFREMLPDFENALGPDHVQTLRIKHHLARLTRKWDPEESCTALGSLTDSISAALGPRHPHTIDTRFEHAESLAAAGRKAEAEEIMRSAAADAADVLGPDHRDTRQMQRRLEEITEASTGS